ncbi:hypothetical protein Bca4012_026455 [Brassica carinata]
MAAPADSSKKNKPGWMKGEHTELKPAKETVDELKPAKETEVELKPSEVTKGELNQFSDTTLELDELSYAEDGAGLAAGRDGPFFSPRKSS